MADRDYEHAVGYADSAMELLKRSRIPPYPTFYELLYTYATGVNPALNSRINELFRLGHAPDTSLADQLFNEFIKSDADERINTVGRRMHDRIEAVHDAIDSAMAGANAYSGSLEAASGDLTGDITPDALRSLAEKLLGETRRMQDTNRHLEEQLEASRDDIAVLQRDLDNVRKQSLIDPLTKIANRKSFDEGIRRAIEEARRDEAPLSLLLLDIDHFKSFNDTYGHQTGDQVLRLVALTLKSNIKGRDIAARYGGEEFAAVLPQTDLGGAMIAAENIRRSIQAKELLKRSTNEKLGRITASLGVAKLHDDDTASSLIERADQCLYAAKRAGRNQVVDEIILAGMRVA